MPSDRHTKEPGSMAWQPESIFNRRDDHIVTEFNFVINYSQDECQVYYEECIVNIVIPRVTGAKIDTFITKQKIYIYWDTGNRQRKVRRLTL